MSGLSQVSAVVSRPARLRIPLVCVASLLTLLALPGCVDPQQIEAFRLEAHRFRDQAAQESRSWEERLAQVQAAGPAAAHLEPDVRAALARAKAQEAAASAAVQQLQLVLDRAQDPESPIAQGVNELSPWLPAPVRLPLALGVALAVSLGRAVQLKRGMLSIAQGLNKAMEEDAAFADRFKTHANTFRTIQTGLAKRAVDEASGEKWLRLPV